MSIPDIVSSIINEVAETVTVRYQVAAGGGTDAISGGSKPSFTSQTIKAGIRFFKPKEITGLIQQGDRLVVMAAKDLSLVPKKGDRLAIDSQFFQVISVNERTAYDENAVYRLQVRGNSD